VAILADRDQDGDELGSDSSNALYYMFVLQRKSGVSKPNILATKSENAPYCCTTQAGQNGMVTSDRNS
jgi:phosphoribosyl-ATP pyrophosphohydrolase